VDNVLELPGQGLDMTHKYDLHHWFICPVDKKNIDYRISLTSEFCIMVEDIEGFIDALPAEILQEQLVDDLKNKFSTAKICVVATHGRVRITSKK